MESDPINLIKTEHYHFDIKEKNSMKKIIFLICLMSSNWSCAQEPSVPVSFVNLITFPEKYKNVRIQFFGYYTISGNFYLTEDHAKNFDFQSSIKIEPDSEQENNILLRCINSYAQIDGVLKIDKDNFLSIKEIKRVRCKGGNWAQ